MLFKFRRYEYFSILQLRPPGPNRHPAPASAGQAGSATSPTASFSWSPPLIVFFVLHELTDNESTELYVNYITTTSQFCRRMTAVLSTVANVKEIELMKESADQIIDAVEERSDKKCETNDRCNALGKQKRNETCEVVDPNIAAIEDLTVDDGVEQQTSRKKRVQYARPSNWKDIAEYYDQWGKMATIKHFPDEFSGRSDTSSEQALRQWSIDRKNNKPFCKNSSNQPPAYGEDIDILIVEQVKIRIDCGLPCDDTCLRVLLSTILAENGKSGLLNENGGKYCFGHSWAMRFWKRHNLVSRVVTTRIRVLPSNFGVLEEIYISAAAQMVHEYRLPPDLVYGQDETNAQFVSRPNKMRAGSGAKRVRLLGVGSEKPQITVTFSLKETGEVVGVHQLIFGGKTKRCEPQSAAPPNTYYDHTDSHWQTPASYITYLQKVVIPDKDATIVRLNLPLDQKALVVHDLHYSHKDTKVLEFMKENNLLSLYIPAGCTDVMQTCDTVANKPFKAGVKSAFRDYLYVEYNKWIALNPDKETRGQWNPKLTQGALKEKIAGFVSVGMDTLGTPEMKICIADAFARDSRFAIIRSDDRQAPVASGGRNLDGPDTMDGDEPEVPGDKILVDDDGAFSAFRDAEDSEPDDSITDECGDGAANNL